MKNIVILGAGTGGAIMANMLTHRLNLKEWAITVIDKADEHVYQPGLLLIPLCLYGYQDRIDVTRHIESPLPRNINFVKTAIKLIDHERETTRAVEPDGHRGNSTTRAGAYRLAMLTLAIMNATQ